MPILYKYIDECIDVLYAYNGLNYRFHVLPYVPNYYIYNIVYYTMFNVQCIHMYTCSILTSISLISESDEYIVLRFFNG